MRPGLWGLGCLPEHQGSNSVCSPGARLWGTAAGPGASRSQTWQWHMEPPGLPRTLPHWVSPPTTEAAESTPCPSCSGGDTPVPTGGEDRPQQEVQPPDPSAPLFLPERWMALPDFPDYHKWGFSLAALNNDVYVTGARPRLLTNTPGGPLSLIPGALAV